MRKERKNNKKKEIGKKERERERKKKEKLFVLKFNPIFIAFRKFTKKKFWFGFSSHNFNLKLYWA